MNKRTFAKTSLAVATAGYLSPSSSSAAPVKEGPAASERDWYELRAYTLKTAKQPLLEDYLAKAFIPAVGRLGLGPVGVFIEPATGDTVAVNVLIAGKSPDKLATLGEKVAADTVYQKDATDFLMATAADPVYERIETFLMHAIKGLPKMEKTDASKPRVLNLRIYESHNERAAAKKIEMFNTTELAIFRRVGLNPVFMSSTVFGSHMPCLIYMLVFDDEAARKEAWSKFGADPGWKALKAIPEYADKEIVSHITNKIMTPAACSQI
jgi:hypothetical protein